MSSQIRSMKETILEQNEMVKTLRADKQKVRESFQNLYTVLVKYQIEYETNTSSIESGSYPQLAGEDMTKYPIPELMKRVASVFGTVTHSLLENRNEVRAMYRELDQDVSSALNEWATIQAQDRADQKALTFRENLAANASRQKATTPEPMVPAAHGARDSALPPSPPESTGKKEKSDRPMESIKTDKPKGATRTLESLISPTKGSSDGKTKKK